MRELTKEELGILKRHADWLAGNGGEQAKFENHDFSDADMRGANMSYADMRGADMRGANMSYADMRGADMRGANMSGANMRGANMRGADMRGANMSGANMSGANMDMSCWPLWCGSIGAKVGDRIAAQLFYHVASLDTSECSKMTKDAIAHIRSMAFANEFCEYRTDIHELD